MGQHRGEIVEAAARKSGFQFKKLAKMLGISRNTLYNRFATPNLSDKFVVKVGRIIHHDFLTEIPDLDLLAVNHMLDGDAALFYKSSNFNLLRQLEIKYTTLLENYNELLKILVGLANTNNYATIKEEIDKFLEDNEEDDLKK